MEQKYLTTTEIAKRTGVSMQQVKRLIKFNKIEAIKFGGRWIISEKALDEYMAKRTNRNGFKDQFDNLEMSEDPQEEQQEQQ